MELTDHQLRLLRIVDSVRWGETPRLNEYNYHLLLRALGQRDPVISFEMTQAVSFLKSHDLKPPPSPPPGPLRSPWIDTWDVPFWRIEAVELDAVREEEVWEAVVSQMEEEVEAAKGFGPTCDQ